VVSARFCLFVAFLMDAWLLGYYLVTFEAAVHHISDLANSFSEFKEKEKEKAASKE
jgi:hypothetical protein